MSFSEIVSNSFFSKILSWDSYIIPEVVSFLGWTGVTVFVFFTGYGLMTKYPVVSNKIQFIKRNYIKLFWLLLPGLLFFFVVDLLQGNSGHFFRRLSYLTMLQNLDYPHLKVDPGVYWYFSLTFQLYLFYAIFNKWMKPAFLLICSALSLIVLYLLGAIHWGYGFSIFRHCFTGWFPVFAIGIYYAQKKISINFTQQPILLNIFQPNYSIIAEEYHIMTAAAIWILDRISEAGNLGPELFKLLPHDESLLDDLFTVTLTDSQYDESLIASVEFALYATICS